MIKNVLKKEISSHCNSNNNKKLLVVAVFVCLFGCFLLFLFRCHCYFVVFVLLFVVVVPGSGTDKATIVSLKLQPLFHRLGNMI